MATTLAGVKTYIDDNLALKANLASPTFTGTPTAPTPTSSSGQTQIANVAFVEDRIMDAIGSITGIDDRNFTPANLVRGFLQGIVDEMEGFRRLICEGTGIEVKGLVASGNACRRNPELRRLLCETFGAELKQAAFKEEAASGAALCMHTKN